MNWLGLLLSLSLLIILHEGGHFAAARWFKVRVEKFYLFFDFLFPLPEVLKFSIFKFKKGDTEYGLGWFPLGGYVKIAGMADESNDKEALAKPPQPWEYRSQKPWKRLIIILGGIIVNLIVGVLVLWGVKFYYGDKHMLMKDVPVAISDSSLIKAGMQNGDVVLGFRSFNEVNHDIVLNDITQIKVKRGDETLDIQLPKDIKRRIIKGKRPLFLPRVPFLVSDVPDTSINAKSGLLAGDIITQIDTVPIKFFDEATNVLTAYKGKDVPVVIDRKGETKNLVVKVSDIGKLQVGTLWSLKLKEIAKYNLFEMDTIRYNFFTAFPAGIDEAVNIIRDYALQFKLFFEPETGAISEVGGFASMAKMYPDEWDWETFWRTTGFLSLVLAFMNFLPIPMLDGGYMVFIIYEMITGKEPNEKFMNVANTIGFIIVIALLIGANGNDLYKFIMKNFG